jgi:outer membrane protein assembly factor BamB
MEGRTAMSEQERLARRRVKERRRRQIARRRAVAALVLLALVILIVWVAWPGGSSRPTAAVRTAASGPVWVSATDAGDGVKMSTFMGSDTRRFYGVGPAPKHLDIIWKTAIGSGITSAKYPTDKPAMWSGTGWTGMPALVRDGGKLYLLIGGYDHKLHKIDAATGEIVWATAFDDIIKSSPSVFVNPHPTSADDKYIVLAGSRRGYPKTMSDPTIAPYRAVSFGSGTELWRLPAPKTVSYSRDVDGSGFFVDGREYIGLEDGWVYALDPFKTQPWGQWKSPAIVSSRLLLGDAAAVTAHWDARLKASNLCLESSPTLMGDRIYVTSGSGFVYGLRRSDLGIVWSYRIGSDIDGSPVATRDGKILVSVEKQYIKGHGGILLLDPTKPQATATKWFLPTGDRHVSEWLGGVLGTPAINDEYNRDGRYPALAATIAVDGNVYVFSQDTLSTAKIAGPNLEPGLATPKIVFKSWMGGGISSPIMTNDTLIAAGYDAVLHLYHISYTPAAASAAGALKSRDGHWWTVTIKQTATFAKGGSYESTPVLWNGRIYIGARNGYFYCLGDKTGA